jgi:protocatechuate 3,4-dioxygenase beta subunit
MDEGTEIPAVTTDSQGHFILRNLEPGRYQLIAQRNGFARQVFGERAPGRGGTPLTIAAGQQMKDVVFRLVPTGALSGRISDSTGDPLPGITVQVLKSAYTEKGRRTFQIVAVGHTDDHGEYRVYSLAAGRYYMSADPAAIQGSPSDNDVVEPGFVRAYYPGTTESSGASAIDLQPGAEVRAVDLTLRPQQLFNIRGRVFDPRAGKAPDVSSVELSSRNVQENLPHNANANINPLTGSFELKNVPPGSYWLAAVQLDVTGAGPLGPANLKFSVARLPIDVVSSDVENVVLNFSSGFTVSGRISTDDGSQLTLVESTVGVVASGAPPIPALVKPDGTFALENISPGEYRVELDSIPEGYYVKAIRLAQVDVSNGMTISGPTSGTLEIVLSRDAGQVEGTVVDKDRKPVPNAQVVLVPEERPERTDAFRLGSSDQNGHFTIKNVVPGNYKLFAWEDIEPFAYADPDFRRKYEELAMPLKVSESSKLTVEAKVIPADQ